MRNLPKNAHSLFRTAAFFMSAVTAFADSALAWEDCLRIARESNAELGAAQANFEATKNLEGVARSGFFPQVTGSLNYQKQNNTTQFTGNNERNSYSATISASENLFSGWQDAARVSQAKYNTEAAAATLELTKAKVSFDLKSGFERLSYSNEYNTLTKNIIKRREENLRLVQLRFESGLENKGSVFLSQAYLQQANYDDLQAHNDRRVAKAQLAQAVGMDKFEAFDISGHVPVNDPAEADPPFPALVQKTPDFAKSTAQEQSADEGITLSRSQFFPSLGISGSIGKEGPTFFPKDNNNWAVGASIAIPLFNGGKDYYTTKSAVDTYTAAARSRIDLGRQLLANLEDSYTQYVEAVAKLKVDESFVNAATVRAEIGRKKYNNGLLTFEEWDLIETDLIARQKTYLASKRDRVVAEASWEQTQGKGVIP